MTPGSSIQSTFVGGEISPSIFGRTDLERFSTSASELENFIPAIEGPITRRVGTQVRNVAGAVTAAEGHLIPFSSGSFSAALLFKNAAINVVPTDSTNTADAVTIATPYLLAHVKEIQLCQVNDVLFLTHQLYPPARLARYSAGSWGYEVIPLENGPYLDYREADYGVTLSISNVVDRMTLTSSHGSEFSYASAGTYVEYNTSISRALGVVVSKPNNAEVVIEPLEERCFSLPKEVYALGRYMGYGEDSLGVVRGTAPHNLDNSANFNTFANINGHSNGIVGGMYYTIAVLGSFTTADWQSNGVVGTPTVGLGFFATGASVNNQLTYLKPNTTSNAWVLNHNVGFNMSGVITNEVVENYLRFVDATGVNRWMLVKKRGDVPKQGSYGNIACGQILTVNNSFEPGNYVGTVKQSERSITATITASSSTFTDADSGRWLRLEFGSVIIDAKITAVINGTTISVKLTRGVPYTGQGDVRVMNSTTSVWRRGAFYDNNYPRCVSFFEQRLCLASTPLEPQTVWLSKTADYYNFAPTTDKAMVEDDSSINVTLATDVFQDIRWMTNKSVLVVGTSNAEWVITAGQNKDALTPKTVTARRESSYGSSLVQAIQSGRSVLFIQNGGIRIRELTYDYSVDANVPIDVTVFAAHLLPGQGGAEEIHYLRQPDPTLITVTSSGQIAAMVYEPDQKVYAWTRFKLGGPGNPKVISACVSQGTGVDTLWMLVLRNGVYTVEQGFPAYRPSAADDVSTIHYFLDSATSFTVVPDQLTYSLASHVRFQGTTVSVLIDNQLYPAIVTTTVGGTPSIVLPKAASTRLWIGFSSTARIVSFPVTPSSRAGPFPGKTMCISKITLRVRNTLDFHYGIDGSELQELKVRTFSDPVNRTPYLRTDDIVLSPPRKFDTFLRWVVESRNPYPISIQMAVVEMTQTN